MPTRLLTPHSFKSHQLFFVIKYIGIRLPAFVTIATLSLLTHIYRPFYSVVVYHSTDPIRFFFLWEEIPFGYYLDYWAYYGIQFLLMTLCFLFGIKWRLTIK